MSKDKPQAALPQLAQESEMESQFRKAANFSEVESKLGERYSKSEMNTIDRITSLLGPHNPFRKRADPQQFEVWLLNNTAYQPINPNGNTVGPWEAEFVACYFRKGRKDLTKHVSGILDAIGLDGKVGEDPVVRKRIEERIRPFVHAIAPARTVEISIPSANGSGHPHTQLLGPSNANGISSQIHLAGSVDTADRSTVACTSPGDLFPDLRNQMRFAGLDGWAIISDIDDTIKVTQTPNPTGILQTTFTEPAQTTAGMPTFYKTLDEQFQSPAWFYISASPYNLYPFLNQFIQENYHPGTIILRDASWMYWGGLLQSLTQGVQEYKTSRIQKVNSWLPKRKIICIGDSTQSDPETYAAMYDQFPGWIKAIYIRKVTDAPFMEAKNRDARFAEAFKDVPDQVWRVFVQPDELTDHVKEVAAQG